MKSFAGRFIGDRKFYKMVLAVAVPIMVQNGITNFVALLDNIMVGRVGTDQMSGVAISNQLLFVFNLCIFGAVSGASIFGAQFFGNRNFEGMRHTFRFRLVACALLTVIGVVVFVTLGPVLIRFFLEGDATVGNVEATFEYGRKYMDIMLIGLIPFVIAQVYSSALREMSETVLPMTAGIIAVAVNLILNYILIFGKLGAPALGVEGAAIATVASRFVECLIVVIWTHIHSKKYEFIRGVYRSMYVPAGLMGQIVRRGTPLLINETMWAAGMAVLMQCYSMRGLEVIAAMNISSTISNLFNIVFMALGNSVAIIVGPMLGANKMEDARDAASKMIAFAVMCCLGIGALMAVASPLFPQIYNTEEIVKELATEFILVAACCMPIYGFMHATYFTLRSGGKTFITFLFDSVYLWVVNIPCAFILSRYTQVPIVTLYLCCQLIDLIKCCIGFVLVKKGVWLNNIVDERKA